MDHTCSTEELFSLAHVSIKAVREQMAISYEIPLEEFENKMNFGFEEFYD